MTEVLDEQRVANEIIRHMSAMRRALRRRTGRVGGVSDLTDAQRELVSVVRRNPGIRIGEAAEEIHVAANTISTLASALEASGWLQREPDPSDARSICLKLTPKAHARVAEWRDRRLGELEAALGCISPAEVERLEQAAPVLARVVELLEERE